MHQPFFEQLEPRVLFATDLSGVSVTAIAASDADIPEFLVEPAVDVQGELGNQAFHWEGTLEPEPVGSAADAGVSLGVQSQSGHSSDPSYPQRFIEELLGTGTPAFTYPPDLQVPDLNDNSTTATILGTDHKPVGIGVANGVNDHGDVVGWVSTRLQDDPLFVDELLSSQWEDADFTNSGNTWIDGPLMGPGSAPPLSLMVSSEAVASVQDQEAP